MPSLNEAIALYLLARKALYAAVQQRRQVVTTSLRPGRVLKLNETIAAARAVMRAARAAVRTAKGL